MTRWHNLSRKQARKLGIEGEHELMQMEENEPRRSRKNSTTRQCPTEFQEQVKLAEYLDMKGYCWCHVPNGGARHPAIGRKMKKQGVKPGVPDVLIFDSAHIRYACFDNEDEHYKGIAIELKRKKGGQLRESQINWLQKLEKRGWLTKVAHGADKAINWLEEIFEE